MGRFPQRWWLFSQDLCLDRGVFLETIQSSQFVQPVIAFSSGVYAGCFFSVLVSLPGGIVLSEITHDPAILSQ